MKVHAFAVGLAAVVVSASSHACKCVGPPGYDAVFEAAGLVGQRLAPPDQFALKYICRSRVVALGA